MAMHGRDKIEQTLWNRLKLIRMAVRMKHSLHADAELNTLIPADTKRFHDAVQMGLLLEAPNVAAIFDGSFDAAENEQHRLRRAAFAASSPTPEDYEAIAKAAVGRALKPAVEAAELVEAVKPAKVKPAKMGTRRNGRKR